MSATLLIFMLIFIILGIGILETLEFRRDGILKGIFFINYFWKAFWFCDFKIVPITVGSRSRKTALGTYFPPPVSLKNVWNPSSFEQESGGSMPSGWIPCSRQYNSQHALPICTPPWPMWMERTSRYWFEILIFSEILF